MKKSIKKITGFVLIFALTLFVGFILSLTSFNLVDYLSVNQMRILFAVDFVCLIFCGAVFLLYDENKKKNASEKACEHKFSNRPKQNEVDSFFTKSDYAA